HLRCGKESSLQCVIGQDLSVAVEPGTALDFPGPGDPAAQIHLGLGRVGVFAGQGQAVALRTDTALVLSGPAPCDLELSAFSQQSLLATSQCDARFSDPKQRKTVALAPYSSALLSQGRLMGPDTLGKRDLSDMNARWERARLFFGQRKELLGAMAAMPEHAAFVKALKKRLAADHAR
ncbi:MAG TPA: hypothetical protein VK842_01990, partial [bacterium]|nr:hypothetical protein [bacterium]